MEFIWLANELNTRLEQVLVVARDGDRLLWDYEIEPSTRTVVTMSPEATTEPDVDALITPKSTEIKKSEEKE